MKPSVVVEDEVEEEVVLPDKLLTVAESDAIGKKIYENVYKDGVEFEDPISGKMITNE